MLMSCNHRNFFDFTSTLNKYYRTLKNGETNRTHVFTVKKERGTTLLIKKDDINSMESLDDILPTRRNKTAIFRQPTEREPLIKGLLQELEVLSVPGIPDIKQVELYTKWRKLLKDENKDITCPKPSDVVLNSVGMKGMQSEERRIMMVQQSVKLNIIP